MKSDELIKMLVKMADKFDREGRFDLAEDIDRTLQSYSARPKAPLKKLDDDVKKNLIVFLHDADKGVGSSIEGLNEFFRRLRYFDVADQIKEMGLDKVVKDMEKTKGCLGDSVKKFYEITNGKRPSQKDLDGLFNDDGATEQSALDFFDSQMAKDKDEEEVEVEVKVDVEKEEEEDDAMDGDEDDVMDGELDFLLDNFWAEAE